MRILHDSNITIQCPHCNASLAVEFSDITFSEVTIGTSTKCIGCNKSILLDEHQFPRDWIHRMN